MEDFKIYGNRKRTFIYSIGALGLVIASVFCFFISIGYAIIGTIGILFFGLCFTYLIYRTIFPRPAVILTNEGIIDHSTLLSTGLIKWEDIKEVKIYDFSPANNYTKVHQKFLGILPKNANNFVESQKWLKRNLLRINQNYVDIPINIPENLLNIPLEKLEQEIKKRMSNTI
jgi:hypothetical protein